MARQPAVQGAVLFLMTRDAESHFKGYTAYPVHCFNLSVTFAAVDLFFNVPLVFEENVFGKIESLLPGDRCCRVKIVMLFLDLRVIRNDVFMTVETFFNRWNPRMKRSIHIGVAESALDLLHPGVHPMAE